MISCSLAPVALAPSSIAKEIMIPCSLAPALASLAPALVSLALALSLALLNCVVVLCVLSSSVPVLLDDVLADCAECIPVPSHGISIDC